MMDVTAKRNNFFINLKEYPSSLYNNERLDKLVTAGILKLLEDGLECTFENIVVTLFKLFPEKFALTSFPQYPDSIRVDNTLRLDCHHSRFLEGNRVKGYTLTGLGKIHGEETLARLESGIKSSEAKSRIDKNRNRYIKLVSGIQNSSGYKKFVEKKSEEINKYDICEVLHGTLDTEESVLKLNLDTLRNSATYTKQISNYEDISKSVLDFLNYIESNWEKIIND